MSFWKNNKILITGGGGFLGSHLVEKLTDFYGVHRNDIIIPRSNQHDLRKFDVCNEVVKKSDIVIHLAGVLGGIEYNRTHSGSLFFDNASMGLNLLEAAREANIKKFVGIGSVCSYPDDVPVPTKEEYLWDGYPEISNASYGLAKKMLLVQSQAYGEQYGFNSIYLILANLYGPRDTFDLNKSHVIPSMIHKMLEAKIEKKNVVTFWGTGKATRDFLFVRDAVDGIALATEIYNKPMPINLASGNELSIVKLAELIQKKVDFKGNILWDSTKPDGQLRRLFDISKAKKEFGFYPKINFEDGLEETINWYKINKFGANFEN